MPNGIIGLLKRAEPTNTDTFENFCRTYKDLGMRPQLLRRLYEKQKNDVLYLNDLYQVAIDKNIEHGFPGMVVWHLSIKRLDKEPIFDWRDMQAIKNQLCGPLTEAVQLFPSEARLVDTSNQFHLFAFMKHGGKVAPRLPLGWHVRSTEDYPGGNAKQRVGADNPLVKNDPDTLETNDDAQTSPSVGELKGSDA